MKFVARMFGIMAVASLLAFPLRADDAPTPGSTAKKVDSVRSRHAHRALAKSKPADVTAEPVRLMSGPSARGVGSSAMGSPGSPASDGQSTRGEVITPKVELFLGYSFIRATPRSTRDRFAWLHGGDTNIAFNMNQYHLSNKIALLFYLLFVIYFTYTTHLPSLLLSRVSTII